MDLDPDPALLPLGGAAQGPDFKTLRWLGPPPLEGRSRPQGLVSCLKTPIWDGILAQDPDPALLPLGGAARGLDPNLPIWDGILAQIWSLRCFPSGAQRGVRIQTYQFGMESWPRIRTPRCFPSGAQRGVRIQTPTEVQIKILR